MLRSLEAGGLLVYDRQRKAYRLSLGLARLGQVALAGVDLRTLSPYDWDAIIRFLLSVASKQPVVLILDDLHWADVDSLRLLRHLGRFVARARVLVETERLNIVKIEDIVEQDRSIDSQVAVLQSRWLAKKTA